MRYDVYQKINRALFGAPKRTDQAHVERLGVAAGLAVFSSDAFSSVAYATEEILLVLAAVGGASVYALPIALAIVGLIFVVSQSYQQTIRAYPQGGGSYIVSKENLGALPGLVAGAALLIDYVLTVAVSVSAGMAAVVSAVPALQGHQVAMALVAIWLITWVNLRGVKESGAVFSVPTYAFVGLMGALILTGLYQALVRGAWHPAADWRAAMDLRQAVSSLGLFMVLHAFSSGCTALTGIEAVSNGVQAFRAPEPANAIRTMRIARLILAAIFLGITVLAFGFNLAPAGGGAGHGGGGTGETLLSQIARTVFGTGPVYFAIQAATMLILILASNTAFADFPRLASLIAQDGYLPRPLAYRGDQLVYRGGILLLAILSSALVVLFHGSTHALIPLYAVGVFMAFTLSQFGMVVHWLRGARAGGWREALRSPDLRWGPVAINLIGGTLSGVVMIIIAATKFTHGAWLVTILIPALVYYFRRVHYYYECFHTQLQGLWKEHMAIDRPRRVKTLCTVAGVNPVALHTLRCARRTLHTGDLVAVHVAIDPEKAERVKAKWDRDRMGADLVVLESPFRSVLGPLRDYVDGLLAKDPDLVVHILVPVVVTTNVFDAYLHNGTGEQILQEFRYSHNVLVTEVPFFLNMTECPSPLPSGAAQDRKNKLKPGLA